MGTLTDMAVSAANDAAIGDAKQAAEYDVANNEALLADARHTAWSALGEFAASGLNFTVVDNPPVDTEQAWAPVPGTPLYTLRYSCHVEDGPRLDLIRPCGACGQVRTDEVTSLVRLGQLLLDKPESP